MKNTDYILKINNANKLQLVVIIYEVILDKIKATKSLNNNIKIANNLFFIRSCLKELICSLNFNIKISEDLVAIYMYINKLIIKAELKNNLNNINSIYIIRNILNECENLLNILLEGWQHINNNDIFKKYLDYENKQELFTNLTYKNGKLEEFIYDDINRGFTV